MKTMRRILRQQRGSVILIAAAAFVMMIGVAALVVDLGLLYSTRVQLTNLADAAALAGVQELPADTGAAYASASEYAMLNGHPEDVMEIRVLGVTTVAVRATRTVPLLFARIFGLTAWDVHGEVAARIAPVSGLSGMMPFALITQPLVPGELYTIKFDSSDPADPADPIGNYHGNFAALANTDRGGQDYRDNIKYGCDWSIQVGDYVTTETGVMVGPTKQGIDYRYNLDPLATFDTVTKDSPRIIVVPVIDTLMVNGRNEVLVVGFAALFLETRSNGKTVTGRFMEMTTPGASDGGAGNYGLYASRLIPYASAN